MYCVAVVLFCYSDVEKKIIIKDNVICHLIFCKT